MNVITSVRRIKYTGGWYKNGEIELIYIARMHWALSSTKITTGTIQRIQCPYLLVLPRLRSIVWMHSIAKSMDDTKWNERTATPISQIKKLFNNTAYDRVEEELTNPFRTNQGVRPSCILNSLSSTANKESPLVASKSATYDTLH